MGRTDRSPHVRESETIFDSGFQSLGSRFLSLELGFRIPVVDSGFLKLHSRFQSPGFQISKAKIPLIPESKFAFMGRDRVFFSRVSLPYSDKLVSLKSNLSLLYYYRYSFIWRCIQPPTKNRTTQLLTLGEYFPTTTILILGFCHCSPHFFFCTSDASSSHMRGKVFRSGEEYLPTKSQ